MRRKLGRPKGTGGIPHDERLEVVRGGKLRRSLGAHHRVRAGRPIGTGGKAEELSSVEIKRIDKCLTGTQHVKRNRALFWLGIGTGLRIAELAALLVGDVFSRGKIKSRIVLEKHSTKSGKSRTVAVSRQAAEQLREYLRSRTPAPSPQDPVFPSQKHPRKPMHVTTAMVAIKRMFEAAGVSSRASSHSLRRTHANRLRRQGADLKLIKEQLGHSSLAITDRYFQINPAAKPHQHPRRGCASGVELQQAVEGLRF